MLKTLKKKTSGNISPWTSIFSHTADPIENFQISSNLISAPKKKKLLFFYFKPVFVPPKIYSSSPTQVHPDPLLNFGADLSDFNSNKHSHSLFVKSNV